MVKKHKVNTTNRVEGAPSVDICEFLPRVFTAIFGVSSKQSIYSATYHWLMILIWFNFAMRPSELLQYCPKVEDIKFPEGVQHYTKDGLPTCVYIIYSRLFFNLNHSIND